METKKEKRNWWYIFRCAVTGLFVTKKYAQENPDTTVKEKVKKEK